MKKFISLIIAVAIIASMCMMAVPASAATPSITGPGTITTAEDGTYSFKVKVSGVPQKNSWIAIFNKEQLAAKNNDYDAAGQYGRFFTQECKNSDGSDIKSITPDGTEVTLSSDKAVTKTYNTIGEGEYVICMFKHFVENDWYQLVAQTDLTVVSPWRSFTAGRNTLGNAEALLHIVAPETYHDTYFTAKSAFKGLSFTAWSDNKNKVDWKFEILDTDENVKFEKITKVPENKLMTFKFDEIPAGDYIFRVSPVDDYDPSYGSDGIAAYYLAMPVSEVLEGYSASCFTVHEGCICNASDDSGENDITGEDSGYAVAFALLPVNTADWDKSDSNDQTPGATEAPDATEAPSDDNGAEEPGDDNNAEEPSDDNNAEEEPGDATAAPEATEAPKATAGASDKGSADKDGGSNLGLIIGIVIAAVVVVAGAVLAVYFLVIKKKK